MPNRRLERRCHWLSKNRTSKRPRRFAFFDTEATIEYPAARTQEHSFRLAVGCSCAYHPFLGLDGEDWHTFHDPGHLCQWLSDEAMASGDLVAIAHNIDYDARVAQTFHYLPRLGWEPHWCAMSPSCTIFEWRAGDARLQLLDNMNLFPVPLADLGRSVGLDKLAVDFDAVDDSELEVYCRRDVEILVAIWKRYLRFLDHNDLGNMAPTIAGQALNAFRHRFMEHQIGIHNNAEAVELERSSYKGGRVECFRVGDLGEGPFYKLDINGLYAAMMQFYPYPRRLEKVICNVSPGYLDHLLQDYLIIAEVVVEVDEPLFPVHVRNRNAYPVGTFQTTLATPELQAALIAGAIRGIGRVALYEPAYLFREYIDFITPLRAEYRASGDFAQSQMCKLLRNALAGKFGQRGHHQKILGPAPLDVIDIRHYYDRETGQEAQDVTFGGKTIRQYTEGEAFDSFPAISGHINAYGRTYMWSVLQQAGFEHVAYIDTDGMIVDQAGRDNLASLIDSDRLGYLKVEGVASNVEIHARKDYSMDGRDVIKGIKGDAERLGDATFNQWHFTTMRYGLRTHHLESVQLCQVRKELKRNVVAGTVMPDRRILPLHVHISIDDVWGLMSSGASSLRWTWEFDPEWVKRLDCADDVSRRMAATLTWQEEPRASRSPF